MMGNPPKITGGNQYATLDSPATKGANIEPIRATVDADPMPIFLTTVGKSSPANK